MTAPTIISEHYLGDAGSHYVDHHQSNQVSPGYALDLAYFVPYLGTHDRVLDFGCGNGGVLRLLDAHVASADGLEVNPHAAAIARGSGQTVFNGLDELPGDPVYDVVLSNHVLEHVRDVATTLEAVRHSMKPGGRLLLKLPLDDWREAHQRGWSKTDIDRHLQTWTPRLIGNVLYEAGFEVDDIQIVTSAYHPKLFPLATGPLGKVAFWALAVWRKRRQLFVVGHVPDQ